MELAETVGYIAGTMTTISFAPQAWKAIRTCETKSLSLPMYIIFTLGVAFWLAYGVLLGELPMIIPNAITLVLAMTILIMKIRCG